MPQKLRQPKYKTLATKTEGKRGKQSKFRSSDSNSQKKGVQPVYRKKSETKY